MYKYLLVNMPFAK